MRFFRKKGITLAAIVFAGIGLSAPGTAGDLVRGSEVYNGTCVACHGESGKGELESVPNFTKANGVLSQSDEVLLSHMINGFQSDGSFLEMPPFGGDPDLTEEDMADVLAYIRQTFGAQ